MRCPNGGAAGGADVCRRRSAAGRVYNALCFVPAYRHRAAGLLPGNVVGVLFRGAEAEVLPAAGADLAVDSGKHPAGAGGRVSADCDFACRSDASALCRSAFAAAAVRYALPGAGHGGTAQSAQRCGGVFLRRSLSLSGGGADYICGSQPPCATRMAKVSSSRSGMVRNLRV